MADTARMVSFVNARLDNGSSIKSIEENLKAMGLKDSEIQTVLKEAKASENVVKTIIFTSGEKRFKLYSNGKAAYSKSSGITEGNDEEFEARIGSQEAAESFEKVRGALKGVKLKRQESLNFEDKSKGYYTLVNFSEISLAVTREMPQFSALEEILSQSRNAIIEKNSRKPLGFFERIFGK